MIPILIQPPAVEPISLQQAKALLRVDHAADDELITALILAARLCVEAASRKLLVAQLWRLSMDAWPDGDIVIPFAPVRQVNALRVYGADNVGVSISPTTWTIDLPSQRVRVIPPPRPPGRPFGGCEVDVVVGISANANGVPMPLRIALRMLVARWYERRGDAESDSRFETMPAEIAALIASYRKMRLA